MKALRCAALLFAACVSSTSAAAQIFYQDIVPDKTMATWDAMDVNIDSLVSSSRRYGGPGNLSIWEEFGSRIVVNAFSDCDVMMSGGYPAALNLQDAIGPTGTWTQPDYAILYDGTQGNWSGATDRYLGVRIRSGGAWLYGWIRMDVNAAGSSVTIKDYACNRTAGAAIRAGQTSTAVDAIPAASSLSLFPHPVGSAALLRFDRPLTDVTVTLYDLGGRVVQAAAFRGGSIVRIERGSLPAGAYLLLVTEGDIAITSRMIVFTK